jgi:hypothetical protein
LLKWLVTAEVIGVCTQEHVVVQQCNRYERRWVNLDTKGGFGIEGVEGWDREGNVSLMQGRRQCHTHLPKTTKKQKTGLRNFRGRSGYKRMKR